VLLEATEDTDLQPLADACGIVTTTEAATDISIADRLAATPKSVPVPVIVVLETATAESFRIALRVGADDVVTEPIRRQPNRALTRIHSSSDYSTRWSRDGFSSARTTPNSSARFC